MFTGLIEGTARVVALDKYEGTHRLVLASKLPSPEVGESIAVNGVCLTLLPRSEEHLNFDLSTETLKLTTLGQLSPGATVNLERSMQAHSRFGGHYVTGHIETTAILASRVMTGDCLEIVVDDFLIPSRPYLLPKGSITLDGVSLTINQVRGNQITVMLVPHTLAETNLGEKKVGSRFNVEFDYLARIIAHQLAISGQLQQEVLL